MSKIAIIDYCGDCPHRFWEHNDMKCELTDRGMHENDPIPEWCPLPEAKVDS